MINRKNSVYQFIYFKNSIKSKTSKICTLTKIKLAAEKTISFEFFNFPFRRAAVSTWGEPYTKESEIFGSIYSII